jgi:glycosyltransferase involved in cell wall biosynthesis
MHIVPNPVPRPGAVADVVGGPARTILSVGRLEPQKDQATLINAFAEVADRFPEWKLRIVGEGSLRPSLEAQVRSLGLGARVELTGAVREISSEYSSAQLFVLSSVYESFGLATAEAMAHGLPVIGFADCPGTNELIKEGKNGLLVDAGDRVKGLGRAMASLMQSVKERSRMAAFARDSLAGYSIEQVADAWLKFIEQNRRGAGTRSSS